MTPFRPLLYRIHITPDLDRFRFDGKAVIDLAADAPVDRITLNSLDLAVWEVSIAGTPCAFTAMPADESLVVHLPEAMSGDLQLQIRYAGHINDRMAGFYRSRYASNGETRYIAVTQFQESDARRAFPCIDNPGAKAVFEIELILPPHLTAVSNTAVTDETVGDDGKRHVRFEPTPVMSSYLVFFGVGEFDVITDAVDPRVRAITVPGASAHARFGLEFTRRALQYCETYYGIPYPLSKLDVIAVPDFAFGAMENWGAITFRENLLLHYPESTSRAGTERICEVIAHELAHQWFGNLVTPADWKFLWLNESFATYFGFGVVDHLYPEWKVWDQFVHSETDRALKRDALHETFPIEIPGGEHVVINASTAPIIYSKGGSVLRQIEGFIGPAHFQNGLRHYLNTHAYGNATSRHLWEALETVSGMPVTRIMKSWIEQPGHPVIAVSRDGDRLRLHQKRFSFLPEDSEQLWRVPITANVFSGDGTVSHRHTLMENRETELALEPGTDVVKLNPGQTGFYRVRYENTDDLKALGRRVQDKSLSPIDRWGLEGDLNAFFREGRCALEDYLSFVANYRREDAFLPLIGLSSNLFAAYLVLTDADRQLIIEAALPIMESCLEKIGRVPRETDAHDTAILRDHLIWLTALFGSKRSIDTALEQFGRFTAGEPVHPDILKSVLQVGALHGDRSTLDRLLQRMAATRSEHERLYITTAIGCFRDQETIAAALTATLEQVPDRNKFIPFVAMAANPHAVPFLWDGYRTRQQEIERFHPLLYERVLAAIIPVCGLEQPDEIIAFFTDMMEATDLARDVIRLSLEKLEINRRIRERRAEV